MKRRILYTLILLLIPGFAYAQMGLMMGCSKANAGGGSTSCFGIYDSTDCDYSTTPPNSSGVSSGDRTFCRKWTATTDGTLSRVKQYFGDNVTYTTATQVGVFNGDTLVATGTITPSADSWVWGGDLSAEPAQSLDFSTNDVLTYCWGVDDGGGIKYGFDTSETGMTLYYSTTYFTTAPSSMTASPNDDLGIFLEYDH